MRFTSCLLPLVGETLFTAVAGASIRTSRSNDTVPGAYLVEFEDSHDTSTFYGNLSTTDISVTARMNMSYSLFNGASFKLDNVTDEDATVQTISAMQAVRKIWPVKLYSLPKKEKLSAATSSLAAAGGAMRKRVENDDAADTFAPHVMTQVDKLRALGYTGAGVKVAVVDTGVDYYHPALGGCFGKDCLVSFGYDLVGDDYDGANEPVPDDDPLDTCEGHGTHVSGIIAAQPNELNFTGAAPGVTLGSYRVLGCSGGAGTDVLIAAFNMAYEAGSDIITASIGGVNGWSEEPWAVAVQRIVEAGVPCTLAAGNDGDYGMFYASGAADGKKVASVASFDNWEYPSLLYDAAYTTDAEDTTSAFGWTAGNPAFGNVSLPLYATSNDSTAAADACDALAADTPDLSERVVLIRRGTCTFVQKATNAAAYGARYIMFYGNTPALVATDLIEVSQIEGCGMATDVQGAAWVEALNAGEEIQLDIVGAEYATQELVQATNDITGGFVSTYSSWGPTWDLDVYPLVGGVGGNVLSTFPLNLGGYAVASGTSMATPLVAAIYALIGQVRGTFDPEELRDLLTTTAKANLWNDGSTTYGELAPVPQQGPGLVQAYDAAFTTTLLTPASISFNDTDHFVESASFVIKNTGSASVTYTIGQVAALTVYTLDNDGDLFPAFFPNPSADAAASLSFSSSSIEVAAGSAANITVSPTPPAGLDESLLPVYSGYITINGTNGENFTIPYLGVAGSMYNAANLDPTYSDLISYADFTSIPANSTVTVPYPTLAEAESPSINVSYPSALYQTNLGTAVVRVDVVALSQTYTGNTTTVLGTEIAGSVYGYPLSYIERSGWAAPFTGMLADGSVVPEGPYRLVVKALRMYGDPALEEDYTGFSTVPFTLAYES